MCKDDFVEIFKFASFVIFLVCIFCIFPLIGTLVGYRDGIESMKLEANKNGHGEYNKETGKWQWKNNKFIGGKND